MQYLNIKKYTVTDNFADTVQIDLDFLTLSRFFLHIPQHSVHHFSVMFVAKCTVNDKAGTGCECKSLSVSCVNRYMEHIVLRFQKIYKCRSDTFVLIFGIDEKPRYSVILRLCIFLLQNRNVFPKSFLQQMNLNELLFAAINPLLHTFEKVSFVLYFPYYQVLNIISKFFRRYSAFCDCLSF